MVQLGKLHRHKRKTYDSKSQPQSLNFSKNVIGVPPKLSSQSNALPPSTRKGASPPSSLGLSDACSCKVGPENRCPRGPSGQKGIAGKPGVPGVNGLDGISGKSFIFF